MSTGLVAAVLGTALNTNTDLVNGNPFGSWTFGGSGKDGAKSVTGDENLASGIYEYTSLTITTLFTLGCSDSTNGVLVLLISGDLTLGVSSKISLDGKGAAGGAAVSTAAAGNPGTQGGFPFGSAKKDEMMNCLGGAGGAGGGDDTNLGGDGGGAGAAGGVGTASNTGAAGTATVLWKKISRMFGNKDSLFESFGAGGGSGASDGVAASGAGGNGGGFIYIECAGTVTLGTSALISANGGAGSAATAGSVAGGGGGGGGGVVIIRYREGTVALTQVTANGGAGGVGTTATGGETGGAGAAGLVIATNE